MLQNYSTAMVSGGRSRLVNVSWNLDKYPDMQEFTPHAKLTVLEQDGPAVVVNIHATAYYEWEGSGESSLYAGRAMWIRIFYNGSQEPAVDMPLMDFLGDVDCRCKPYATQYFSKTRDSHNFYLLLPFERHIRIEVENRSERRLFGYMTFQVEELAAWDKQLGYLHVQYRDQQAQLPEDLLRLMDARGDGMLVAHWLQIETGHPLCRNGDYICEGNDEIYIDGEEKPSFEYLGTEDFYGFSWGFQGEQSDGRCAIIRQDKAEDGIHLCMLRTRLTDRIRFFQSCCLQIDYREEFFSSLAENPRHRGRKKEQIPISFKSACYYYLLEK